MDNPVASPSWSAKKVKRWLESFVPDYILMDILSRLQLKYVLQCRCVCKRWRDLLSTPEFELFYKERDMGGNVQMILVDERKIKGRVDQFFLGEWHFRMKPIIRRILSYPFYRVFEFSQEGFLVMSSVCSHSILIVNPFESRGVKILCPSDFYSITKVYGIFFNPTLREHCVLFGEHDQRKDHGSSIHFRMLTLGAKPCWRNLCNPFNCKPKFQMLTMQWAAPVLVGDYLYWLVVPTTRHTQGISSDPVDIMEFNIRSEEFALIQHVPKSPTEIGLLNIDGFLSSVQISTSPSMVEIDIWTLKDGVARSWTSSKYCVTMGVFPFGWFEGPRPIAVECEELIFESHTAVFACNLKGKTTRICGNKKHHKRSRFFCHSISLMSLKKCKSVICMEGVDEKKYIERCEVCSKLFKEETSSGGVNKHSDVVEEPATHIEMMEESACL